MRPLILLLLVVGLIVAALFALSGMDTEVATTRVERPVANDKIAR